ncbi:mechanosensitive ion channel family protein [Candidatus Micrarchaeota archaeon]|nr:mechanosensitive ion channel family protein [Candidatus Micrarchaeota archaeon]MBU1166523.1 mechanosensitive ion channel family protein [Candidatus Micrarchaeota archaeon]MBU1887535.1 mechanosensitive ion channel family protein [Candidatus Micrarchaeota archaeon]
MENISVNLAVQNLGIFEPFIDTAVLEQIKTLNPVIVSIGFIVVSFILATIAIVILSIITKQLAKRTKTEFDDKLLESAQQPIFRLIVIGGLYLAVMNISTGDTMYDIILKLILTLAYVTVILFIVKGLGILVEYGIKDLAKKTDSTLDDEIVPIFHKAAVIITWAFGLIIILGAWGVDVGPFLAGLGIAGLAVSFAMQTTLSNIIAGVALIMDKTFKVGDKIQLDSGDLGTVHEISLRSTRIKTYDNEIILVPNDTLAKARIKNFTQPDLKVRVNVPFSVEYGNDPEKVAKLIEDAIRKNIKGILTNPPVSVVFTEMAASSLNFQARLWIDHYDRAYDTKIEANNLIYKELNKAKIGIPFPTQIIYLKK